MPNTTNVATHPLARLDLQKMMGKGRMFNFLDFSSQETVHFFDDFLVDTINLDAYAVANSSGTGAANFAVNVQSGGVIRSATGTDDNGSVSLITPLIWYGDQDAGCEIRLKVDVVTGYNLEFGFIDAVPGSNASGVSDVDTPATAATDCALIQIDTDQTLTTLAFVTNGGTSGQDAVATTFPTGSTVLTAATYATFRIQLVGNNAFAWMNDVLVASHDGDADGAVEGGTALAFWVYVRTRNTTTKLTDIDYIRIWQNRA